MVASAKGMGFPAKAVPTQLGIGQKQIRRPRPEARVELTPKELADDVMARFPKIMAELAK